MAKRTVGWRMKGAALIVALGTMSAFSIPSTYNLTPPVPPSETALPDEVRYFTSTPPDVVNKIAQNFQRRVAISALLRLGAVEINQARISAGNPYGLQLSDNWKLGSCVSNPNLKLRRGQEANLTGLVVSLIAAENFNRSNLQRSLKFLLARAWARTLHTLPPFSLGIAEIKPQSLVRVLGGEVDTGLTSKSTPLAVVEYFEDDCNNVKAVAAIVVALYSELRTNGSVEDWSPIVRRFHGDVRDSPAPFGYSRMVQELLYVYTNEAGGGQ